MIEGVEEAFNSLFQYRSGGFIPEYKREEKITQLIEENKSLVFKPQKISLDSIKKVQSTLLELENLGYQVQDKMIGIECDLTKGYLTAEDCKLLKALERYLKDNHKAELFVVAPEDMYTVDDIVRTNAKLDAEIEYIKSLTVSTENNRPLNDMEKFLMVYDFCTNFKYQESSENLSFSRNITSILNSTNIVCVGYAELMKEMCSRLNIECYKVSSTIYRKEDGANLGGHANNIVVLDGKLYHADACWDSTRKMAKGLKLYNHCLIPIKDKEHIVQEKVKYEKPTLGALHSNRKKIKEYLAKVEAGEEFNLVFDELFITHSQILEGVNLPQFKEEWDMSKMSYKEFKQMKDKFDINQKLNYLLSFYSKYEYGEAIPYEEFEIALKNTYLAKGMNENSAQNLLERTMQLNEDRARTKFDAEATNLFVAGRRNDWEV